MIVNNITKTNPQEVRNTSGARVALSTPVQGGDTTVTFRGDSGESVVLTAQRAHNSFGSTLLDDPGIPFSAHLLLEICHFHVLSLLNNTILIKWAREINEQSKHFLM